MDSPNSKRSFSIASLPKGWVDPTILTQAVTRYRDLRLQSLQISPEAYGSTYACEVQFPQELWEQRLRDKNVTQFIATTLREHSEAEATLAQEDDWIGMIVVHEKHTEEYASASKDPWSYNQSRLSGEEVTGDTTHSVAWYQLNGLFVHPSSRRSGLGRELIRAALAHVKEKTEVAGLASTSATVVVIVDTWNKGAIALYSNCGFGITREDEHDVNGSKRRAFSMSSVVNNHP